MFPGQLPQAMQEGSAVLNWFRKIKRVWLLANCDHSSPRFETLVGDESLTFCLRCGRLLHAQRVIRTVRINSIKANDKPELKLYESGSGA